MLQRAQAVKEALRQELNKSSLSREQIADELSRLVGRKVSVHQLNNWAAPEKRDRYIPLEYVGALVVILGNPEIVRAALEGTGLSVIDEDEMAFLELGKITAEDLARKKRKKALLEKLGI